MKRSIIATALIVFAHPCVAGEAMLGLGYNDALDRFGSGSAAVSIGIRGNPLLEAGRLSFGAGAGLEGDADGDAWAGAGIWAWLPVGDGRFRIEADVMAGAYRARRDDLGSTLQFRSRFGASWAVSPVWRLGVMAGHVSNAHTAPENPGNETVYATVSRRF